MRNRYKIEPQSIDAGRLEKFNLALLIFQVGFIFAIFQDGIGSAGGVVAEQTTILSKLFLLLRVDYLTFFSLLFFPRSKYFKANIGLYLFSSLLRGWLGGLITVFLLYILRRRPDVKISVVIKYSVALSILVSLLPMALILREQYRLSGLASIDLSAVAFDFGLMSSTLIDGLHVLVMRFQQMEGLIFFLEHFSSFVNQYNTGQITPVYFEGIVFVKLYRIITDIDSVSLGYALADYGANLIAGRKTAFTSGLITYALLDSISIIYIVSIPWFLGYLGSFFDKYSGVRFGIFYCLMTLFSFGWANELFGAVTALICFTLAVLLLSRRLTFGRAVGYNASKKC